MFESIEFKNFKALRNTRLPLGRFTLIVGPNGSGKSTALRFLDSEPGFPSDGKQVASFGCTPVREQPVEVVLNWGAPRSGFKTRYVWTPQLQIVHESPNGAPMKGPDANSLQSLLPARRVFAMDADKIKSPTQVQQAVQLDRQGAHLAAVLDDLRDKDDAAFEALNDEVCQCLPEYEQILFDKPTSGHKVLVLRTRKGSHRVPASELSSGTLYAVALLTLAYIPDPPPLIGLEEPDHGIHPRLLRELQDAIYRLAYPDQHGLTRPPVQVVATTHSPYFLDLFRDHPDEVVLANKAGNEATFERLSDQPNLDEILEDSRLGDAWYTGILGGVPVAT